MTPGSVLVLGLGNALLADDAVGLTLLAGLSRSLWWGGASAPPPGFRPARRLESRRRPGKAAPPEPAQVEFLDGGTQGLALLGRIAARPALLILDAVAAGAAPGTVHVLEGLEAIRGRRASTAHESNARELLEAAELLGEPPGRVAVVGIEPAELRARIGLSPAVEAAVPEALARARDVLGRMRGLKRCTFQL